MPTTIIHIKDAPTGWETNSDYVYCGRSGHGLIGKYGNPFLPRDEDDRNFCCDSFETYWNAIYQKELRSQALTELKDKILVCFCVPKRCHCITIANFVNNHYKEKEKNNGFFNERT